LLEIISKKFQADGELFSVPVSSADESKTGKGNHMKRSTNAWHKFTLHYMP